MRFVTRSALAALLVSALWPATARAQESRLSLSFTPAVASVSGDSEFAWSGTAAYRFTDHFAFEGDVTWINAADNGFRNRAFDLNSRVWASTITSVLPDFGALVGGRDRTPILNFGNVGNIGLVPINLPDIQLAGSADGQTWIGTMGLRYEPRVQTERFQPYLSAGFGLNYTNQQITIDPAANRAGNTVPIDQSISHSGIAFSAGGGAHIKLVGNVWAGADAKYFRLSRDRDVIRLGGGVTFKF